MAGKGMSTMRELTKKEALLLESHRRWVKEKRPEKEKPSLAGIDLSDTDLRGACLYKAELYYANLTGTWLNNANLREANLAGAVLENAHLSEACLTSAYLDSASLEGSYLGRADLSKANLRRADLRNTDLAGANLYAANIGDTTLYQTNLENAHNVLTLGPIGSRLGLTYAVRHPKVIMIKCGCFWGTFEEWMERCREAHRGKGHAEAYAAAATFIRAYANSYWAGE